MSNSNWKRASAAAMSAIAAGMCEPGVEDVESVAPDEAGGGHGSAPDVPGRRGQRRALVVAGAVPPDAERRHLAASGAGAGRLRRPVSKVRRWMR